MKCRESEKAFEKLRIDENYVRPLCDELGAMEPIIAKKILEDLIALAKENKLDKAYSWLIHSLGWILFDLENIEQAISLQEEAYELFKEQNETQGILCAINALLVNYSNHQMYDIAIEWALHGIDLAKKAENYERLSVIKSNLVHIYFTMQEYEKCRELLDEIERLSYIGSKEAEAFLYCNRAVCEMKTDHLESAEEYLKKSAKIIEENCPIHMHCILRETGRLHLIKGDYERAEEELRVALAMTESNKNQLGQTMALVVWAELNSRTGKYQKVIESLKPILESEVVKHSRFYLKEFYTYMSRAYEGIGNYQEANQYLKKQINLQQEVAKMGSDTSLSNLNYWKKQEEAKTYKLLYSQTEVLYGIGQKITSNLDKEDIFNIIAKEIKKLINADQVQIANYKEEEEVFEYQVWLEEGKILRVKPMSIYEESFGGYAIRHQQEIMMNDIEREHHKYFVGLDDYIYRMQQNGALASKRIPKSCIFIPIKVNHNITGVIGVVSYEKEVYRLKDLNNLRILSTYIGIALENARLYKEVKHAASFDVLTNVLNRREWMKKAKKLYKKVRRGTGQIAIVMMDIDNFKKINDTYGHSLGDQVIIRVAETIKACLGKEDKLGRYGGEEFVAIINIRETQEGVKIAEEIRQAVEQLTMKSKYEKAIQVTISIGVAALEEDMQSLEQMIDHADTALYVAKDTGKNKVLAYQSSKV